MKVHCNYDKLVETNKLKPNPKNPNVHPKSQLKLLAKILQTTGWRSPIVVSNLSGYVVKGHGRLSAARMAGFKEVPVDYQDYKNKDEETADLLADNKLSELSQSDKGLVKALLGDLDEQFDVSLTGYDEAGKFIDQAVKEAGVEEEEVQYPIVSKFDENNSAIVICCSTEEEYFKISEMLNLEKMASYKSPKIGSSRVVSAKKVIENL